MTDFAEGDKVVLIDSDGCLDDWSDFRGTVMTVTSGEFGRLHIRIKPAMNRPDGFKMQPFYWDRELIIKEDW